MVNAAPITVRWVDAAAGVPDDVWAACFPPPLEGRWWYVTLEASGLGDQFTFAYAILEAGGRIVGVAPTFLMDVPLDVIAPDAVAGVVRTLGRAVRFLRYQRTLFVGSPCADQGTVGLMPGVQLAEVLPPLQDALDRRATERRASMVVYKDFADQDAAALSSERRLFRVSSFPGTRLTLGGGFEGYLARLDGERRHKLRKKLRRGTEAVPTTVAVVRHLDAATLAEAWPLFWQTYLKGRTKFERLTPAFFDRVAAEPTSHFVLLRHAGPAAEGGGRLVAFMLCFDCRPRVVNKFIGLDYAVAAAGNLYYQLWAAAVRWAGDAGFAEIQSGQTGYRFKLDTGNTLVPLANFARHRRPLVHRLFAWQARSITWATIDPDLREYLVAHPDAAEKVSNREDAKLRRSDQERHNDVESG